MSETTDASSNERTRDGQPSRKWLIVAVLFAFTWLSILSGLVFFTANPVTFNRQQILESDIVVVATITNINPGGMLTLKIEEELLQGDELQELTIAGHESLSIRKGDKYLLPLSSTDENKFNLTPTELPGNPPLVYPATESSIAYFKAQLKQWR